MLFQFPAPLYYTIAAANLSYGTFSLALALRSRRRIGFISALAIANAIWGVICLVIAVSIFGRASIFGMMHVLAECALVLWLAHMEWTHRTLIAKNDDPSK